MIRAMATGALFLAWAGAAGAIEAQDQIKNCQQGNAGIAKTVEATERFIADFKKVKGNTTDDPDFSVMFDGPRLAALNEFFASYKALGPQLDEFATRLATVQSVIGACAAGNVSP